MKAGSWIEVPLEAIAAPSHYPIGDGDHGAIKPAMYTTVGIPYIRVADICDGEITKDKLVYIPEHVHRNNPKSHLFPNDIIISKTGATIGKVAIIPPDMEEANTTSSVGKITVDLKKALPRFVVHYMRSPRFQAEMWAVSHKSAQPGFNIKDLKQFLIPLPPLAEQERVVKLLDEADELRKLRFQANQRTAALIPALFHEIFGYPFAKSIPYPVKRLRELVRQGDKINYGVVQPGDEVPVGVPIVRAGDFNGMSIDQQHIKRITPNIEKKYIRSRLRGDEILITCVGAMIGSVALADPSLAGFNIVRAIARVPLCSEVDRVFVANQLITPELQNHFRRETRTVAQPTLNIRQIEETPIILPPLPLQQEFAQRVTEIRELETTQIVSHQCLDSLFKSMLHRAFNGEL